MSTATVGVMSHAALTEALLEAPRKEAFPDDIIILVTSDAHMSAYENERVDWLKSQLQERDLCLAFDDVEHPDEPGTPFSWRMAEQMLQATILPLRDHLEAANVVVSCQGGVSRSAAIAAFLVQTTLAHPKRSASGDVADNPFFGPAFAPNKLVFDRLATTFELRFARRISAEARRSLACAKELFQLNAKFYEQ